MTVTRQFAQCPACGGMIVSVDVLIWSQVRETVRNLPVGWIGECENGPMCSDPEHVYLVVSRTAEYWSGEVMVEEPRSIGKVDEDGRFIPQETTKL